MQRYVWPWFVKVKEDGDVRHIAFPPTPLLPWLPDLYMRYAVLPIFWFMQSSVTLLEDYVEICLGSLQRIILFVISLGHQ
jgi:hypothetical protein